MTAIVSVDALVNGIFTADDLNSKKVKTQELYNLILYKYGAKPVPPANNTIITPEIVSLDL